MNRLPEIYERDLEKAAKTALELQARSTRVVGWYGTTYGDGRAQGMKTIRGPFGRWFALMEGSDDHNGKSQGCLAEAEGDIEYAAYAMNNAASLAEGFLALREAISNPEALAAAGWKLRAQRLEAEVMELAAANGKKFDALINCNDEMEKMRLEIEALKFRLGGLEK